MRSIVMVGPLALLAGCLHAGPWASSTDRDLFATPPVVVEHRGRYVLRWTQGSYPFFFHAKVEVIEGRVVVSVLGSSSSGMLAGRLREVPIDDPSAVAAIASFGGAYFWEPEPRPRGRLVPLVIRHEP